MTLRYVTHIYKHEYIYYDMVVYNVTHVYKHEYIHMVVYTRAY
jgi:hypothetical protein